MYFDEFNGEFTNAIHGNSDGGAGGTFFAGSFDDYVATLATGAPLALSTYGRDTADNQVWAILDHATPYAAGIIGAIAIDVPNSGDFNNDGSFDCSDVDSLVAEISAGTNAASFDLNGDDIVDSTDLSFWLAEAGGAELGPESVFLHGDANLDGFVDVSDLNVWSGSKFTSNASWCSGDFNADGFIDVSDLNIWSANKFQTSDQIAVPEPAGLLLGGFAGLLLASRRRRMSSNGNGHVGRQ